MTKKLMIILLCLIGIVNADDFNNIEQNLRKFPPNTIFGTIQGIDYPQIKLEEIPSNIASGLLGVILLQSQYMSLSPATVIRDKLNNTQLQKYLDELYKQPVAIQPDFQGRVWVIWQLTEHEKVWVIDNKLNSWK